MVLPEAERSRFWSKFDALEPAAIPQRYEEALRAAMPGADAPFAASPRSAGTGSLGRPRFVARADWNGGPVLREAKAVAPSAWSVHFAPGSTAILAGEIARGRFRSPDPHYHVRDGIVVRRLSPNSRKIEVKDAAVELVSPRMLEAMGWEIANCHANASARSAALRDDLARRNGKWLCRAAKAAARAVAREHAEYA